MICLFLTHVANVVMNFLVMQVEKAENFDAVSCVIKVHMHFAVETRTHSPLYKHLSYLAKALTFF